MSPSRGQKVGNHLTEVDFWSAFFDLSKVWFLQYDRRLVTANNIVPKGVILLQIRVVGLLIQRTALLLFLLRRRDVLNSLIPI